MYYTVCIRKKICVFLAYVMWNYRFQKPSVWLDIRSTTCGIWLALKINNYRAVFAVWKSISVYTMMWMLCSLGLVITHVLLEYRYMHDITGNLFSLFCSTCRVVLKMFVRLFWIKGKWKARKNLVRAIYKEEKWRKGEKKSSLQLKNA